jgi:NDP-sugar pyrophosphorylase family protein
MLPTLLLTAGLGTRLRPLSSVRAKPALPVAGEPLVRRILRWLAANGVDDVVLNLHHLPATVCAAVGEGADLGVRARYSWEDPVLGSAGGPRRALPLLGSNRFFVINGDTLTDMPLAGLVDRHHRSGALVTLAVVPNDAPDRYGGVLVNDDGEVVGFVGRGSPKPSWHFIGVQVAEARAFMGLPANQPAESINMWYPALIRTNPGCVRAVVTDASFVDIGTPAAYLATSLAIAGAAAAGRVVPGSPLVGSRTEVAPSARLVRSILWDDVTIGDNAWLTECVVADAVRVPAGVRWQRKAVVPAGCCAAGPGDDLVGDLLLTPIDRVALL